MNISMSSTSISIIPGNRSTKIRNISEYANYLCECKHPTNSKVKKNYNQYVTPQVTQVQRQVDTILYSQGGRVTYGNGVADRVAFLGKREGQPGGINGPIRNRF
jgi:hypothetical protein